MSGRAAIRPKQAAPVDWRRMQWIGWLIQKVGSAVAGGILLVAPLALSPSAAYAADLPYLSHRLQNPAFKSAFAGLFHGQGKLAPWVRNYLDAGNGVETPGKAVKAAGRPYELYAVCEPHNCSGNFIYVLFSPGGHNAWGLFTKDGAAVRFFGKPTSRQRALLQAAVQE